MVMKSACISDLEGKVLGSIKVSHDEDEIRFYTIEGVIYKMYHEQDCCESVYIEDIIGDLDDLVGQPILMATKETNSPENENEDDWDYSSQTWTFYKLATIKGSVTLRWLGTSNGYYSESVDFVDITEGESWWDDSIAENEIEFLELLEESEWSVQARTIIWDRQDIKDRPPYTELPRQFKGFEFLHGVTLSVQASQGHYCTPRKTLADLTTYEEMEIALLKNGEFVSADEMLPTKTELTKKLFEYFEGSVYSYVPVDLIEDLFQALDLEYGLRA